jgi:amino acid transporter, AAT family
MCCRVRHRPPPFGREFCATVRLVSDSPVDPRVGREQVLARDLTTGQQAMMAVGGAIGTGLFLGSGLAVNVAGPGVVLSYVAGSFMALLLGAALTEMCVAHPTAGSFGVYAEMYVSPFAGYAVRVSYWLMQIVATGGHMVAVSIYMRYWFPAVPGAVWIVAFSVALVYVNSRAVASLGRFEYWFAMIKVAAIAVFIVSGVALLAGWLGAPAVPDPARTGILPHGVTGVLLAVPFVIYSFIGVEIVGVTSGEAREPERTIPAAFLRLVIGLSLIYIVTTALLVRLVPWQELGVGESPFVRVLSQLRWPFGGGGGAVIIGGVRWTPGVAGIVAGLMNIVVLSAALSSANANLYLIARTLFSLGRGGYVPTWLGAVSPEGTPVRALVVSSVGLGAAVVIRALWPDSAYVWFFGVALFGALFVWLMIFVTHLAFRRYHDARPGSPLRRRVPFARAASAVGAVAILTVLLSTWWVPDLRITLVAGVPWLALLGAGYAYSRRGADHGERTD